MAFKIPTIEELSSSIRGAFRSELPGTDAAIWPNNITPTVKAIAGACWAIYLKLEWLSRQIFVSTADGEFLDKHAVEYGMNRLPASFASGNLVATSSDSGVIENGAIFQRSDGLKFVSTERVLFLGATNSIKINVQAYDVGKLGNTLSGSNFSVVSGAKNIISVSVSSDGIGGGADAEQDDAFRMRILFRKQNPPHGGSASDYVQWGLNVPGVTRVFVERLYNGAGTIRIFPVTDDLSAGGIPSASIINAVQSELLSQAPATAVVVVQAPIAQIIDITISGLLPSTAVTQQSIVSELSDMFKRVGRVSGSDTIIDGMPFLATSQTFSRSWIWQAISNASGEERHQLIQPQSDIVINRGCIPVLGTVTFT